jgi:Rrf2 family protein
MNLIQKKTDYAIQALCRLARAKKKFTASVLRDELKISYSILRGVLQVLNRKGVLRSQKGTRGGFTLAVPPERIPLLQIIELFQGKIQLNRCVIKNDPCRKYRSCVLRIKVDEVNTYAENLFGSLTIASLQR